jgi:uncharacterized lipoprotein NlpE involved in copper resistance
MSLHAKCGTAISLTNSSDAKKMPNIFITSLPAPDCLGLQCLTTKNPITVDADQMTTKTENLP